jgi:hypothetical protein
MYHPDAIERESQDGKGGWKRHTVLGPFLS